MKTNVATSTLFTKCNYCCPASPNKQEAIAFHARYCASSSYHLSPSSLADNCNLKWGWRKRKTNWNSKKEPSSFIHEKLEIFWEVKSKELRRPQGWLKLLDCCLCAANKVTKQKLSHHTSCYINALLKYTVFLQVVSHHELVRCFVLTNIQC